MVLSFTIQVVHEGHHGSSDAVAVHCHFTVTVRWMAAVNCFQWNIYKIKDFTVRVPGFLCHLRLSPHQGSGQRLNTCPPLFFRPIAISEQTQEKSPFFILHPIGTQRTKCPFRASSRQSTPLAGPGTEWLLQVLSLAPQGLKGLVETASCDPDELTVCGPLVNRKRSTWSCSNHTRRGEPGPPRCS